MKNTQDPYLQILVGKTIAKVAVSNSHGEILSITCTDGTELQVCSTYGLSDPAIEPDRHSIYVAVNQISI